MIYIAPTSGKNQGTFVVWRYVRGGKSGPKNCELLRLHVKDATEVWFPVWRSSAVLGGRDKKCSKCHILHQGRKSPPGNREISPWTSAQLQILKLQISAFSYSFDTKRVTWQCKCKRWALFSVFLIPPLGSNKRPHSLHWLLITDSVLKFMVQLLTRLRAAWKSAYRQPSNNSGHILPWSTAV